VKEGFYMAGRTYKVIELVGTSDVGVTEAINEAVNKAAESLKALDWFEVSQIRGQIENQKVAWYQVDLKVGFRVMSSEELMSN
jgi:flavin-binding protein dodecin